MQQVMLKCFWFCGRTLYERKWIASKNCYKLVMNRYKFCQQSCFFILGCANSFHRDKYFSFIKLLFFAGQRLWTDTEIGRKNWERSNHLQQTSGQHRSGINVFWLSFCAFLETLVWKTCTRCFFRVECGIEFVDFVVGGIVT